MPAIEQVVEGAWRIELPLPWAALPAVNAFLFRQKDGFLLLDTGLNIDRCAERIEAGFGELGIGWSAIRRIVVSHMHPDHIGGAKRSRELTGAPVLMQPDEARLVAPRDGQTPFFAENEAYLARHGAPANVIQRMKAESKAVSDLADRLDVDGALDEGDEIEFAGGTLHVLRTPGHSPALLCFYCPEQRALFSSDLMLDAIVPHVGLYPYYSGNPLGDYFDSLARVRTVEIERVIPSHGNPFADPGGWIDWVRRVRRERSERILEALKAGPASAFAIAGDLWGEDRPAYQRRMALAEALAHLEFLASTRRVEREEHNGLALWRAAS